MKKTLTIITRMSQLALWQANFVREQLLSHHAELDVKIKGIKTSGDRWLDTPLYKIGGKSLFVKELEQALLEGEADIAVHSLKDVPAQLPPKLTLAAILERESPFDAWVCPAGFSLENIPTGSRVGTSSLRRLVQMKKIREDLIYEPLRGNVDSRVQKCHSGAYQAIVLAEAGLKRLKLTAEIQAVFTPEQMLPAVGQGALGLECRMDDTDTLHYLSALNHVPTQRCVEAERAMNAKLGGSCQVPIAGFAQIKENQLHLQAKIGHPEKPLMIAASEKGDISEAKTIGEKVAFELLSQGAMEIIQDLSHE
jgi:hydroxymethylbilane synthase